MWIPTGEKETRDKGWNKSWAVEDLAAYFDDGHRNIGLLLGEPSGWPVDVDGLSGSCRACRAVSAGN